MSLSSRAGEENVIFGQVVLESSLSVRTLTAYSQELNPDYVAESKRYLQSAPWRGCEGEHLSIMDAHVALSSPVCQVSLLPSEAGMSIEQFHELLHEAHDKMRADAEEEALKR